MTLDDTLRTAPWTTVRWVCRKRGHRSYERLTEQTPYSRVEKTDLGCPYCFQEGNRHEPLVVDVVYVGTRGTAGPKVGYETGGRR